jgi:hypothetical protein
MPLGGSTPLQVRVTLPFTKISTICKRLGKLMSHTSSIYSIRITCFHMVIFSSYLLLPYMAFINVYSMLGTIVLVFPPQLLMCLG